jgi:hypothetical protein
MTAGAVRNSVLGFWRVRNFFPRSGRSHRAALGRNSDTVFQFESDLVRIKANRQRQREMTESRRRPTRPAVIWNWACPPIADL